MSALEVGSDAWNAERRTGIGGTTIGKILGLSPFGGPMDAFLELRGLSAPLIPSEAMIWGSLLEEPVAKEYAIRSGRKVRRAAAFLRRKDNPWAYANIDRWSLKAGTPRRVLEVKTAGEFAAKEFGEPNTDQVPGAYLTQCAWYEYVTGVETVDLAALIGGQRYAPYVIEREPELITEIVEVAAKFWADTQQGIPPEIDGSDASAAYLAQRYSDTGTHREMDDQLAMLATNYVALKEGVKAYESQISAIGNKIRSLMGDDRVSEGDGVRILYSSRSGPTRTDWPALAVDQGISIETVDRFTKTGSPTRALTVTLTSP